MDGTRTSGRDAGITKRLPVVLGRGKVFQDLNRNGVSNGHRFCVPSRFLPQCTRTGTRRAPRSYRWRPEIPNNPVRSVMRRTGDKGANGTRGVCQVSTVRRATRWIEQSEARIFFVTLKEKHGQHVGPLSSKCWAVSSRGIKGNKPLLTLRRRSLCGTFAEDALERRARLAYYSDVYSSSSPSLPSSLPLGRIRHRSLASQALPAYSTRRVKLTPRRFNWSTRTERFQRSG